jgi:hypothetical protein
MKFAASFVLSLWDFALILSALLGSSLRAVFFCSLKVRKIPLPPDKNIIWYFNGDFYLGSWETDMPTQGQKNGHGF